MLRLKYDFYLNNLSYLLTENVILNYYYNLNINNKNPSELHYSLYL